MKSVIIALKEIKTYLRDRGDLSFSLLLPIIIFALMYGAFGGQFTFHGTAYVVDEDDGAYGALLLERLEELDTINIERLSASDADSKLERSDILLALYIPPDFSENLAAGEPVQLTFKQRGNGGQEGQIVAGIVRSVAEEISQEFQVLAQVKTALAGQEIDVARIEAVVAGAIAEQREDPSIVVREDSLGARPDPVREMLPGIVTMFVLFALTIGARAIVEERKNGTLERLMTTQLGVGQLVFGKFLAGTARGFVQTVILLGLGYAVFQIFTPLSFLEVLVVAVLFAAAASAIGMLIATLARSEDAATWIGVFITMAMTMLGGTFFTIEPGTVMDTISRFSINTYANTALKEIIVSGGSLADTGTQLLVMAGVIVVALGLGRLLFKVIPGGR